MINKDRHRKITINLFWIKARSKMHLLSTLYAHKVVRTLGVLVGLGYSRKAFLLRVLFSLHRSLPTKVDLEGYFFFWEMQGHMHVPSFFLLLI